MGLLTVDWPKSVTLDSLFPQLDGRSSKPAPPSLVSFRGREELSRLFHFELEIDLGGAVDSVEAQASKLLGKPLGFQVQRPDQPMMPFHGIVRRYRHARGTKVLYLDVVPWLWNLTLGSECKVYHGKSVPTIVAEVFEQYGFKAKADFRIDVESSKYADRAICVQYRETAFNFVSRLLEHEGIYYYFEFAKSKHVMVLGDSTTHYGKSPTDAPIPLFSAKTGQERTEAIAEFHEEQRVTAGQYQLVSYDSRSPRTKLAAATEKTAGGQQAGTYSDFALDFSELDPKGESYAKMRMEEEACTRLRYTGQGDVRGFHAGRRFELAKAAPASIPPTAAATAPAAGEEYVLTAVTHMARHAGGEADSGVYLNAFVCIPVATLFRPTRLAPWPVIEGVQSATVVARDSKKEIDLEDPDQVFIRFPWDQGKPGWCPARVGSSWAGKGFGLTAPLRANMEVAVAFVEGDPDHPVVVQVLYNGDNAPPYDPASQSTVLALRTASSPKGSKDEFSEIAIDDKKGEERISVKAQKDLELIVAGNWLAEVAGDRHLTLQGSVEETISKSLTTKADEQVAVEAGQDMVFTAKGKLTLRVSDTNYITIDSKGVVINGSQVKINCKGGAPGTGKKPSPKKPTRPTARPAPKKKDK